jgi:hypothetical protein
MIVPSLKYLVCGEKPSFNPSPFGVKAHGTEIFESPKIHKILAYLSLLWA